MIANVLKRNGVIFGLESKPLNREKTNAIRVVDVNQPTSIITRNKMLPNGIFSFSAIALGIPIVIQKVQRRPFARIIANIFPNPKLTLSFVLIDFIFQTDDEIHINIPAPTNESAIKKVSGKPRDDRITRLTNATKVSDIIAKKTIRKLL